MVYLVYTTYTSVDLAQYEIVCAKVGKGGINAFFHGVLAHKKPFFLGYINLF